MWRFQWHDSGMDKLKVWFKNGLRDFMRDALTFPWKNTALTLRERFKEDHLGLTASSLTFTTIISIVPLFTVALAIFSVFPMFAKMQTGLQQLLVDSLIPDNIARQVLSYLGQFASKASKIGWVGAAAFLVSALMLILTIDGKLNEIWRVRTTRHLARRIIVYWTLLTLGPLLLAMSLSISSYVMSASKGWVSVLPGSLGAILNIVQFTVLACSMAAMYRFVPNTHVRWTHALLGGTFVALGIELAKRGLALYLAKVPSISAVYGAFATVPILLIWIYVAWVVVLLGAVLAAYSPSLRSGIARRGDTPGWNFQLAIEILQALSKAENNAESHSKKGKNLNTLSKELRVDDLQLEAPIETLIDLDWIAKLDEEEERFVILIDPSKTLLKPLTERLLLPNHKNTPKIGIKFLQPACYLSEVL